MWAWRSGVCGAGFLLDFHFSMALFCLYPFSFFDVLPPTHAYPLYHPQLHFQNVTPNNNSDSEIKDTVESLFRNDDGSAAYLQVDKKWTVGTT